jgi:hypothetical protein
MDDAMSSSPAFNLQARVSERDPRFYNINRDVAHNFKLVARHVAARLEDGAWPELNELLQARQVTQDDLGLACQAFCLFVATSIEDPQADMEAALDRCGWSQVKPEAQVAVMAYLGTVLLGMHFAGVREVTFGGQGPALELADLAAFGEQSSKLITHGRWARRWRKLTGRFRRALAALRGRI